MRQHTASARRGVPFNPDPDNSNLKSTLAYFITHTDEIYPIRLQKLTFYTDYRHYQDHGEQLTSAAYTPYMYGMWSHQIEDVLETLDTTVRRTVRHGDRTVLYLDADDSLIKDSHRDFLDQIQQETDSVDTNDLAQFSKSVPMHELTDYNDIAEFNDETVVSVTV